MTRLAMSIDGARKIDEVDPRPGPLNAADEVAAERRVEAPIVAGIDGRARRF